MSNIHFQIAKESTGVPKIAIGLLAAIVIAGVFVTGFDAGQLEQAFGLSSNGMNGDNNGNPGTMWLHEFSHDARHAAGFACH